MIVEIAGMPRSGKTSIARAVADYAGRKGREVRMVPEYARVRPFSRVHRVDTACWIANQALSTVIEASRLPSERITVQDRGLFDALIFLRLLRAEDFIDDTTLDSFLGYFAAADWCKRIDHVFVFTADPDTALTRDLAAVLGAPSGSVTNLESIERFKAATEWTIASFDARFQRICLVDSSAQNLLETARIVLDQLAPAIG